MNVFSLRYLLQTFKDIPMAGDLYENNCLVMCDKENFSGAQKLFDHPTRFDALIIAVCQEGTMSFSNDFEKGNLEKNKLVCFRPGEIVQITDLGLGKISTIIMDVSLLERLNIPLKNLLSYISIPDKRIATLELSEERMREILGLMRMLSRAIKSDVNSLFYHEKVRSLVQIIFYTCTSIYIEQLKANSDMQSQNSSRDEEYLRKFFGFVRENYDKERSVIFYADCVHLSPKYLSAIVKRMTGKTASQWIDGVVIHEAKNLLKNSGMTVQQVAFALNFSTQSFFGKYFKHHTGMSPREYQLK